MPGVNATSGPTMLGMGRDVFFPHFLERVSAHGVLGENAQGAVAPLRPAEFVVVKLSQKVNQPAV